ncbi:MAG: DUF502 domain-containing protein [Deltaproteobacteria bacterium]|nr:DUF502 domain-containing protein [Deltaproteobacteria bacterium]
MSRVRKYFITGLLVVVPLYMSVYVLVLIVKFMDGIFNILPQAIRPDNLLPFRVPGLGIIFTAIIVLIAGILTQNLLGRKLIQLGESLLARVPIFRLIYNATKQLMETFFNKEHQGFRKVVLVEFPRKGIYSMGFMTGTPGGEIKGKAQLGAISVFIPTTPNPTTGFYIIVPESEVVTLEMKVEDAFKIIMTGGLIIPPDDRQMAAGRQYAGGFEKNGIPLHPDVSQSLERGKAK